jgi:hypothetical protein
MVLRREILDWSMPSEVVPLAGLQIGRGGVKSLGFLVRLRGQYQQDVISSQNKW